MREKINYISIFILVNTITHYHWSVVKDGWTLNDNNCSFRDHCKIFAQF